jgi:N-formylglutamate amidohydrolase
VRKPLEVGANHSAVDAYAGPEICIGTDEFHTSPALRAKAIEFYQDRGFLVLEDQPFCGSIVPSCYYKRDFRVQSLMVEFNRSLLIDENNGLMRHQGIEVLQSVRDLAKHVASY